MLSPVLYQYIFSPLSSIVDDLEVSKETSGGSFSTTSVFSFISVIWSITLAVLEKPFLSAALMTILSILVFFEITNTYSFAALELLSSSITLSPLHKDTLPTPVT